MHFSLFELLLLIGCTQGIFTSVLLFLSKKNVLSNKFLALGILSFCLLSAKILLNTLGFTQLSFFRYVPIATELALAPLFYFYLVSLIDPGFKLNRKIILHFVPFIISQSYSFCVYFSVIGIADFAEKDLFGNRWFFNEIKHYEDYVVLLSIVSYIIPSYLKLRNYRTFLNDNISDCSFPDFRWLFNIMLLSGGLGVFLMINLFLDLFFDLKETVYTHWQAYFMYLAGLIYYLGFIGYKQPDFDMPVIKPVNSQPVSNKLSQDKLQAGVVLLNHALEVDRVYLNPTINAADLAKQLQISQSHLSQIVNQHYNRSFRNLVNDYRIDEVKQKLLQEAFSSSSILALALQCGFNSEASFYRIFKRATGMSPKEYSATHKKD